MRAVVLAGVALAGLAILMTAIAAAMPHARRPASEPAIISIGKSAAIAARADGSTRVELPWLLPGDTGVGVAANGHDITFASARSGSTEIYVVNAGTGVVRRLTDNPATEDVDPSWSPDGRRLVWASGPAGARDLFVMDRDGGRKHRLVEGAGDDVEPAWSPDGVQVAFASNRGGRFQAWVVPAAGGEPTLLVEGSGNVRSPSWSPSGASLSYSETVAGNTDVWVARADMSAVRRITTARAYDGRAVWSPDGRRLAFVSTRGDRQRIWLMRSDGSSQRPLAGSPAGDDQPTWSVVDDTISPDRGALLPDLDQQAPTGILVLRKGGKLRLGFTSAVDNIGDGPIHIRGTRFGSAPTMRADQIIHHRDGARSRVEAIGRLAYESHPPHFHWHLEPYERYELRRASDDTFVARDGKSGFCLLDRWGHALRRAGITPGPPAFVGDCAALSPAARTVDEGSSVGYTDRYPAFFHGQDIDIDGLPPGLYVLVHRANPELKIRELRYSNNASSALIRLSAANPLTGAPSATVLRRCPATDQCPPG